MFDMFNQEEQKEEPAAAPTAVSAGNIFVLSVGGSILIDYKPNTEFIREFSACLNNLISEGYKFVVVLGGGKVCRNYLKEATELGANNFFLDNLGIAITRINASLLTLTISNAYPKVLTKIEKSAELLESGKTPVYGGLMPGFTTDAVAALLAEALNATFVNLSNVAGIFSADPAKNPDAEFYPVLSYNELIRIISSNIAKPGQNLVLDLPAAVILQRSKIHAIFLDGNDLENFSSAIRGQQFTGTVVAEDTEAGIEEEEPTEIIEPAVKPRKRRRTTKKRKKRSSRTKKRAEDTPIDPDEIDF